MRSCGYSFSVYQISAEDYENIDQYVEVLHSSFSVNVETKLYRLRQTVHELNSKGFFEGEGIQPFRVRLIVKLEEYGAQLNLRSAGRNLLTADAELLCLTPLVPRLLSLSEGRTGAICKVIRKSLRAIARTMSLGAIARTVPVRFIVGHRSSDRESEHSGSANKNDLCHYYFSYSYLHKIVPDVDGYERGVT